MALPNIRVFDINTLSNAHIVAQIEAKRLATKDSQDNLQEVIVEHNDNDKSYSSRSFNEYLLERINYYYEISKSIDEHLGQQDVIDVGYPAKCNKTTTQLDILCEWVESQKENDVDIIENIKKGLFFNGLSNDIDSYVLPNLQSPSNLEFWGNENPSLTTLLLSIIAHLIGDEQDNIPGAATWYPFLNKNFKIPDGLVPDDYPLANTKKILLIGNYQYGGHSYFKKPLFFGSEDCSSSVGKAIGLTYEQVKDISTARMIESYSDPEKYGYGLKPITFFQKGSSIGDGYLNKIQPGDIGTFPGHTFKILKADNNGNIVTGQFGRNLAKETVNKTEGGGQFTYNIEELIENKDFYIQRPTEKYSLHETCGSSDFIRNIRKWYNNHFLDGPSDIEDCYEQLLGNILYNNYDKIVSEYEN